MAKKLFVGSFSLQTNETILRQLFSKHGQVLTVTVITDINTGQNRGFGFVEMESDTSAQKAITELNGFMVDGSKIVVKEALLKTSYKGMNARNFGSRRPRRY